MVMRLVIAEKPSLGRAIAQALPGRAEPVRKGEQAVALRCGEVTVTWAFGHLLEMAAPEAYDPRYKRWSVQDLPIVPQQWQLVEKEPAQLRVIAGLLKQAREVIHAGDPDREGQLLIDEILQHLGWRGPTKRLLLNATDEDSVRKAWAALQSNERFAPLFQAALCRQRADWLIGMNASRAATLLLTQANQLVPVGRVMTPTLALVVARDRAIECFVEQTFYKLVATVRTTDGKQLELEYDPEPHLFDRALAQQLAAALQGQRVRLSVQSRKAQERAPLPWHLGDFSRVMQKRLGLTLARSLAVLQSLYEKQLASYPRTDCRYLPAEQKPQACAVLKKTVLQALPEKGRQVLSLEADWKAKDYIYDSSKVAEHHGLVPTGKLPQAGALSREEEVAWQALVEHFARTLLPHHEYIETTVGFEAQGCAFARKARTSLNWEQSWRLFDDRPEEVALPKLADAAQAVIESVRLQEGKTTPPQRYTEATLAADMEAAAKFATDERIKARLKETSGIGTAATRAAIIEKLKAKGMLAVIKKGKTAELVSTPFGREVVDAMPRALVDVGLTAAWEEALNEMAAGRYEPEEFMRRVLVLLEKILQQMRAGDACRIRSLPTDAQMAAPTARRGSAKTSSRRAASQQGKIRQRRSSPRKSSGSA